MLKKSVILICLGFFININLSAADSRLVDNSLPNKAIVSTYNDEEKLLFEKAYNKTIEKSKIIFIGNMSYLQLCFKDGTNLIYSINESNGFDVSANSDWKMITGN